MSGSPGDRSTMEQLLQAVEFEPRASLGAEILARARHGEPARPARAPRLRWMLGLSAALAILAAAMLVVRRTGFVSPRPLTVDRCCQDLDGGGGADDGVLVVTGQGDAVARLAVYEDRDGSRSLTAGDSIRFMRTGALAVIGPLGPGVRTAEFCCRDYDGGGLSDDALVVVGHPPDRISMAAIYEYDRSPGHPARLR